MTSCYLLRIDLTKIFFSLQLNELQVLDLTLNVLLGVECPQNLNELIGLSIALSQHNMQTSFSFLSETRLDFLNDPLNPVMRSREKRS